VSGLNNKKYMDCFRIYHWLKTFILYKPFLFKSGSRIIICNPILISLRNLKLGSNVFIRNFARIEAIKFYQGEHFNPLIEISDSVNIEQYLHLTCSNNIKIGSYTAIASNVTITDINHSYYDITLPPELQKLQVSEVVIKSNCKIYNNAVILPGVILGNHCIVGANSVLMAKEYRDFSIIVGAPAKVIKRYSFEKEAWLKTDSDGNFIS